MPSGPGSNNASRHAGAKVLKRIGYMGSSLDPNHPLAAQLRGGRPDLRAVPSSVGCHVRVPRVCLPGSRYWAGDRAADHASAWSDVCRRGSPRPVPPDDGVQRGETAAEGRAHARRGRWAPTAACDSTRPRPRARSTYAPGSARPRVRRCRARSCTQNRAVRAARPAAPDRRHLQRGVACVAELDRIRERMVAERGAPSRPPLAERDVVGADGTRRATGRSGHSGRADRAARGAAQLPGGAARRGRAASAGEHRRGVAEDRRRQHDAPANGPGGHRRASAPDGREQELPARLAGAARAGGADLQVRTRRGRLRAGEARGGQDDAAADRRGMESADEGRVSFEGQDLAALSDGELSRLLGEQIAWAGKRGPGTRARMFDYVAMPLLARAGMGAQPERIARPRRRRALSGTWRSARWQRWSGSGPRGAPSRNGRR